MSTDRVRRYRLNQKKLNRFKREFYLTDAEFKDFKDRLIKIRSVEPFESKPKCNE